MLKSAGTQYRFDKSSLKLSDLNKGAQENIVLSLSILGDLYDQGYTGKLDMIDKKYLDDFRSNLNTKSFQPSEINKLSHWTKQYLSDKTDTFSEYRKKSSLPLVRQLQESYDAEAKKNGKDTTKTVSAQDTSISFPAADSHLKLFGRDNEPINLNDIQGLANTAGGGIFADIMRMTSSITEDAVEVRTLSSQKFDENKFKKNDKKAEMIAQIKNACKVIDEKIKNIKEEETVNSSLNLDVDQLANLARNLLDIRVGFNKMSGMPQYNQGTFVQDVSGMGNTSNNSGDFDAPRPSYFKGNKTNR